MPINGRITGKSLQRQYNLAVQHCLYHRDGQFYETLRAFPGALCDPEGYVQFETEAGFMRDPRLQIGAKVNVPRGVYRHPRYRRFADIRRPLSPSGRS